MSIASQTKSSYRPHQLGKAGEDAAVNYLIASGHQILERNWRGREGELDIIAQLESAQPEIIFIEVKTRSTIEFGAPIEAITKEKYRRLYLLGREWIATHQPNAPWRIDLLALVGSKKSFRISHIKGLIA
jgi:putative endonuclease